MSFESKLKEKQDFRLKCDAHYACISAFHNGSSESYVRHYHEQIKHLESINMPDCVDLKIKEYKLIIDFVVAHIPPKIKWIPLTCNN